MSYHDFLHTYYAIPVEEKIVLDGKEGYKHDEYFYFIINVNNKEVIHMEQAALAYYLMENGYSNTAFPIQNIHGEWFTMFQDKLYMVLQVQHLNWENALSAGELLAAFHQIGTNYGYEPQEISSYGHWKALWIDKLTVFETNLEQEAKKYPSDYYRLTMDVLPYIIGISENAIQYLQESERDNRFHESDQGTISFRRYAGQLEKPILWTNEFVYDHPSRDLAEYVRYQLLENDSEAEAVTFLKAYQTIRPLSVFSWRLLYARLIFPVPLFDLMQRGFLSEELDPFYVEMTELLDKQSIYERRMRNFFQMVGLGHERVHIPVVEWF